VPLLREKLERNLTVSSSCLLDIAIKFNNWTYILCSSSIIIISIMLINYYWIILVSINVLWAYIHIICLSNTKRKLLCSKGLAAR
jgi:hypothetical protein